MVGRIITLLSQLLIGKLIYPDEFGSFGIAITITTIINICPYIGLDTIYLQRSPRQKYWSGQIMFFSMAISIMSSLLTIALAPTLAAIYRVHAIELCLYILSVSFPLNSAALLAQSQLRSQFKFRTLAIYNTIEILLIQILMISFALAKFHLLSLILPIPIAAALKCLVLFPIAKLDFRHRMRIRGWRPVIARAGSLFVNQSITTVVGQGDYMVLGLMAEPKVVGFYFFAFRLTAQPMMMLASTFTGILTPTLIGVRGDRDRQSRLAFRAAELLSAVAVPVCLLQGALADAGLKVLFGDKWAASVPLIQILSIGIPLDAASWVAASLLQARGEYSRILKYQAITAPIFFTFVVLGTYLGSSDGTAVAVCAYYIVHPLIFNTLIFRQEGYDFRGVLISFLRPLLAGLVSIGTVYLVSTTGGIGSNPMASILFIGMLGPPSYVLALRVLAPDIYEELLVRARRTLLPRLQRPRP